MNSHTVPCVRAHILTVLDATLERSSTDDILCGSSSFSFFLFPFHPLIVVGSGGGAAKKKKRLPMQMMILFFFSFRYVLFWLVGVEPHIYGYHSRFCYVVFRFVITRTFCLFVFFFSQGGGDDDDDPLSC